MRQTVGAVVEANAQPSPMSAAGAVVAVAVEASRPPEPTADALGPSPAR